MDRAEAIAYWEGLHKTFSHQLEKEENHFGRMHLQTTLDVLDTTIAALREQEPKWISVEERLPEVEKRVLVCVARHSQYTNKDYTLVTCAIYEDGKVNVEDSCWMCEWGDYDEEADIIHVPEGWYEYHEYGNVEEDGIAFIGDSGYLSEKVTHWMPLPEPPKEGAEG